MPRRKLLWGLIGLLAASFMFMSLWPPRPGFNRANYGRIRYGMQLAEVIALFGERPTYSWTDGGDVPSHPVRTANAVWKTDDVWVIVTSDDSGRVVGKQARWDREPALLGVLPEGAARKWRECFPEPVATPPAP